MEILEEIVDEEPVNELAGMLPEIEEDIFSEKNAALTEPVKIEEKSVSFLEKQRTMVGKQQSTTSVGQQKPVIRRQ